MLDWSLFLTKIRHKMIGGEVLVVVLAITNTASPKQGLMMSTATKNSKYLIDCTSGDSCQKKILSSMPQRTMKRL